MNKKPININFQAGLSNKLIKESQNVSVKNIEKQFQRMNIDADFKENKPVCFCYKKAFDVFLQLKNFSLNSLTVPRIRVFTNNSLFKNIDAFCIPESCKVLENEHPFETGSIFQRQICSIEKWNEKIEHSFNNNNRSSNHFLSDAMHEILHAVYIKHLYKKYGYTGNCLYTKNLYPAKQNNIDIMAQLEKKTFDNRENNILKNFLGNYSTTSRGQYHEVFAETFTKLICDSLNNNAKLTQDPFERLKMFPKEFLVILYKILNI